MPMRLLVVVLPFFTACSFTTLQLSAWRDGQLFSEETPVVGARLGLLSSNRSVHGVDAALLGAMSDYSLGVTAAPYVNADEANGIQLAFYNASTEINGVAVAIHNFSSNRAESKVNGVQLSGGLAMTKKLCGVQVSLFGNGASEANGVQLSAFNIAPELNGLQAGLVNIGGGGLQLGLLNWNENEKGETTFFPFVNW